MLNINVGGVTYPKWSDIVTWLIANPMSQDINLIQIADINQNVAMPVGNITSNGFTLKLTQNNASWHKGDPTSGYVTTVGIDRSLIFYFINLVTFIVERLRIESNVVHVNPITILQAVDNWGASTGSTFKAHDLIIKGNRVAGGNNTIGMILGGRNTDYLQIYNNKIYDCTSHGIYCRHGTINPGTYLDRNFLENNTVYRCRYGYYVEDAASYNWSFKNCIAIANTTSDWNIIAPPTTNTFLNCADGDNSLIEGTNNLHNRVAANEFQSVDSSNTKFLFLKNGAINLSASRDPSGNLATKQKCRFTPSLSFDPSTCTIGIAGIAPTYAGSLDVAESARPGGDDLYSIGCHEQQYV